MNDSKKRRLDLDNLADQEIALKWFFESDSDEDFQISDEEDNVYELSESDEDEDTSLATQSHYVAKSGLVWNKHPSRCRKAKAANIIKQSSGLSNYSKNVSTIDETFKLFINATYKMCCVCFCTKNNNLQTNIYESKHEGKFEITEPFYQHVNRETAEELLQGKQNGTFIIRPSSHEVNIGILSVTQDNKIFHLVIRQRKDTLIALGNEKCNEKTFKDLNSLINYYISNYLILYSGTTKFYALLLPYNAKVV
ncbi:hypothetical protein RN001_013872 [Aquatica leii]|uniref:SH2 domain-containing protein n=1 Tax=Aquatica leii TaxID=1421715 RepID=A0AAN7P0M8_9COLE|nr:hypothetical protein RN001_013872 [Aquatica leii]